MFRQSTEEQYEQASEAGTRHLFALGHFEFRDALDGEGELHHFVLDSSESEGSSGVFETDQLAMYEFMARFLAGEYEKREYRLERSPAQDALLDTLEIAAARARGGETTFVFDDLDGVEEWDEELDDEEEG
ncbi:MAG: hypothetical protein ICV87_00335 [Gemmatimonadetes bacterium]|nr:hypothetical protein [Gemmatimonadota bacterium]